jgi:hypothetical protein
MKAILTGQQSGARVLRYALRSRVSLVLALIMTGRTRPPERCGAKQAMRKRDEMVERSFAHILDRGGMRHAANSRKRYLIHVAWFNLGIQMRAILGKET